MGMGARSRRVARIRSVSPMLRETLDKFRGFGEEADRVWWSLKSRDAGDLWVSIPISRNGRGDEPLVESNWRVAEARIEKASCFGEVDYRIDKWPGGTIETLQVRIDDAGALREAWSIVQELESFPVLDEEDYARLQAEELQQEWDSYVGSDVYDRLRNDHGIPESILDGEGVEPPGPVGVDDGWLLWPAGVMGGKDGPAQWEIYGYLYRLVVENGLGPVPGEEGWDVDMVVSGVAEVLVKLHAHDEDGSHVLMECACCRQPCYGRTPWELCSGCVPDGGVGYCDYTDSWHCGSVYGDCRHGESGCDGTDCTA